MARFKYTAVSVEGRSLSGEAVAVDAAAVAADLARRGLLVMSLDRLKQDDGGFFSSPPRPRAITGLLGELALMLKSGLPLDEALDLSAKGQPARLARIVTAVRTEVLGGASFVQALERHPQVFTRDILAMARVGDATGDLDSAFAAVAAQRERAHRLSEKVTGSLRYPAFLIVSAIGVMIFFLIDVIPNFSSLFADSGSDPGALVRFVLALSDGLLANETAIGAGTAAVLLGGLLAWRTAAIRNAVVSGLLSLPVIRGVSQLWRSARFLSNLSVLLGQGVPLTEALKVLEDAVGAGGRAALASVGDVVRRGGRLHEALGAVTLLPPVAVRMVRIGEETGALARVAGEAGNLYAVQLEKRLDTVSAMIGPAAILAIAGLIGGLMVTIMSALVSVNQAVL